MTTDKEEKVASYLCILLESLTAKFLINLDSKSTHTHTHTHIHTYIHTHTYTHIHTHIYTHAYTHIHTQTYTHTHTHIHTHIYNIYCNMVLELYAYICVWHTYQATHVACNIAM